MNEHKNENKPLSTMSYKNTVAIQNHFPYKLRKAKDNGRTSLVSTSHKCCHHLNGEMSPSYVLTEKEIIKTPAYSLLQSKC